MEDASVSARRTFCVPSLSAGKNTKCDYQLHERMTTQALDSLPLVLEGGAPHRTIQTQFLRIFCSSLLSVLTFLRGPAHWFIQHSLSSIQAIISHIDSPFRENNADQCSNCDSSRLSHRHSPPLLWRVSSNLLAI